MVLYASCPRGRCEKLDQAKKFGRKRKKFLTKGNVCDRMSKLTREGERLYLVN